ncbi:MAG: hypothetical protein SAL07_14860 [Oscillatoria sp. PMC 1051.18]|nr:hypothetical protein [Oscillatoria sp. PMC 1051.18]
MLAIVTLAFCILLVALPSNLAHATEIRDFRYTAECTSDDSRR